VLSASPEMAGYLDSVGVPRNVDLDLTPIPLDTDPADQGAHKTTTVRRCIRPLPATTIGLVLVAAGVAGGRWLAPTPPPVPVLPPQVGLAWQCGGTVTVVAAFSGLPQTVVRLFLSPDPSLESGLPQGPTLVLHGKTTDGGAFPGYGFVADNQGRLEVITSGIQMSRLPATLQVRVRAGLTDSPLGQVTVSVEQCPS
jgi:hypothetical protein